MPRQKQTPATAKQALVAPLVWSAAPAQGLCSIKSFGTWAVITATLAELKMGLANRTFGGLGAGLAYMGLAYIRPSSFEH
jgi:hypothetical protein